MKVLMYKKRQGNYRDLALYPDLVSEKQEKKFTVESRADSIDRLG